MSPLSQAVYEQVKRIPRGKVATYGLIARLAGYPRAARAVGFALHRNPQPGVIPCHRVVFRDGSCAPGFAFGGPDVQRSLLESEGITFTEDGRADLSRHLWDGDAEAPS